MIQKLQEWSPLKYNNTMRYNQVDMIEFAKYNMNTLKKDLLKLISDGCSISDLETFIKNIK